MIDGIEPFTISVDRRNRIQPVLEQIHRLKPGPNLSKPKRVHRLPNGPHWLWRDVPPYRTTAAGICFSYGRKGGKANDS